MWKELGKANEQVQAKDRMKMAGQGHQGWKMWYISKADKDNRSQESVTEDKDPPEHKLW